ncbi:hypothetical protein Dimus_024674 [Dionaea muscipula]
MVFSGGSLKRTKIDEHGGYSSSSNPEMQSNGGEHDEPLVRPPGIKAAKRKGKGVAKGLTDEISREISEIKKSDAEQMNMMQQYLRLKEKELEVKLEKERTKKYNLLIQLISRDSLSETEQLLRDKLQLELFGS